MGKKKNQALAIAQDAAQNAMFDEQGNARSGVHGALLKAVDIQRPLVVAHVARLKRRHPKAAGDELLKILDRQYLATVTTTGAGAGAAAVIPGVGTGIALAVSGAATAAFLEATALYASSVAELHGIRVNDPEKARTMVMAIILGEEGTALLSSFTGQSMGRGGGTRKVWGSFLSRANPLNGFAPIKGSVQKAFTRWLIKHQGSALVGRVLPFGIGAAVGGGGNLMMGRAVINNTREAFAALPVILPGEVVSASEQWQQELPGSVHPAEGQGSHREDQQTGE